MSALNPKAGKSKNVSVLDLWRSSDSGQTFAAALAEHGYILAKEDTFDFWVIDPLGDAYSLAPLLKPVTTGDIRRRMAIGRLSFPTLDEARKLFAERNPPAKQARAAAPASPRSEIEKLCADISKLPDDSPDTSKKATVKKAPPAKAKAVHDSSRKSQIDVDDICNQLVEETTGVCAVIRQRVSQGKINTHGHDVEKLLRAISLHCDRVCADVRKHKSIEFVEFRLFINEFSIALASKSSHIWFEDEASGLVFMDDETGQRANKHAATPSNVTIFNPPRPKAGAQRYDQRYDPSMFDGSKDHGFSYGHRPETRRTPQPSTVPSVIMAQPQRADPPQQPRHVSSTADQEAFASILNSAQKIAALEKTNKFRKKSTIAVGSIVAFFALFGFAFGFGNEFSIIGSLLSFVNDYATSLTSWRVVSGFGCAFVVLYWLARGADWLDLPKPPLEAVGAGIVATILAAIALGPANDTAFLNMSARLLGESMTYRVISGALAFVIVSGLFSWFMSWVDPPKAPASANPPGKGGYGPYAIDDFSEPSPYGNAALGASRRSSLDSNLEGGNKSDFNPKFWV